MNCATCLTKDCNIFLFDTGIEKGSPHSAVKIWKSLHSDFRLAVTEIAPNPLLEMQKFSGEFQIWKFLSFLSDRWSPARLIAPTQERVIFRFQWILFSFLFTNWVWIWRWNAPNASLNTLISSLWMRFNFSANLPLCFAKVQLSTLRSRDFFLPIF